MTMDILFRYWKIWRINPAAEKIGYKKIPVPKAQEYINNQVSQTENSSTQDILLSSFYPNQSTNDILNRALSTLCLRCYVSEPILKECKKLDFLFSGDKQFSYRDLLPFVLNDDGQNLVILDRDGKTQLTVDENLKVKESKYKLFTMTVLQTFNPKLQSRMSLENWAHLQTKQNYELKKFLSEFGFNHLSDWALLNRVRNKQLKRLSVRERHIVGAFHSVYRRDRQQNHLKVAKKCPDPTNYQLQEMLIYLQRHSCKIQTPVQLIKELKQIVLQLRSYDIWASRESLDIYDEESGTYVPRKDLSSDSLDEAELEQQEFLDFVSEQLYSSLAEAIKQQIEANMKKLQKSKKYASFAQKYIYGLYLYYSKVMSLKEITPELGMTSWDQARRILNPGELLSKIRAKTVEQMLETVLRKAAEKGLTKIPPEANYLMNLSEQIESYVDKEIFQQAVEEIRAGKNRTMNSPYANQLKSYIQESMSQQLAMTK